MPTNILSRMFVAVLFAFVSSAASSDAPLNPELGINPEQARQQLDTLKKYRKPTRSKFQKLHRKIHKLHLARNTKNRKTIAQLRRIVLNMKDEICSGLTPKQKLKFNRFLLRHKARWPNIFAGNHACVSTTQHDNWVYFEAQTGSGVSSVGASSYPVSYHRVSSGQPYGGTTVSNGGIDVKAGRHGTSQVSSDFNNRCSPNSQSTFGHTAGDLNFFTIGDLTLGVDGDSYDIPSTCLAQGHSGSSNNWWVASAACNNQLQPENTIQCLTQSGKIVFLHRGGAEQTDAVNHIWVAPDIFPNFNQTLDLPFTTPPSDALCIYNATPGFLTPTLMGFDKGLLPYESRCYGYADSNIDSLSVKVGPSTFNVELGTSNDKGMDNGIDIGNGLLLNEEGGNFTLSYAVYESADPQPWPTSTWMKSLPDATPLNELVMPATHDAGMSQTRSCDVTIADQAWVKTQNLDIKGQAEAGSRYFDVRPEYTYDCDLTTYHNGGSGGCYGETISAVLNDATGFVTENPSEFLILKVSHTHSQEETCGSPQQAVVNAFSHPSVSPFLFTYTDPQTNLATIPIGSLRGKIVVVADTADGYASLAGPDKGFIPYTDYGGGSTSGFTGLHVYDHFSNSPRAYSVASDQRNKLTKFGGLGQPYLFLLSWTTTGSANNGLATELDIEQITNTVHGLLPGYLRRFNREGLAKPNLVYFDFIDPILVQTIIQQNHNTVELSRGSGDHPVSAPVFDLLETGVFRLQWQPDGNLVIYQTNPAPATPVWSSNTNGSGTDFSFQGDGNMCIYRSNGASPCCTNTADAESGGNGGQWLELDDVGNLVVRNAAGKRLWWSRQTQKVNECF